MFIWMGWAMLATGCALLVLLDDNTAMQQWIFITAVPGFGLGSLFLSQAVATQAASEKRHIAIASALSPFFRTMGQALGIVVGNTIIQNILQDKLRNSSMKVLRNSAQKLTTHAINFPAILPTLDIAVRQELSHLFLESLRGVWWCLTGCSLAALALSLAVTRFDISGSRSDEE